MRINSLLFLVFIMLVNCQTLNKDQITCIKVKSVDFELMTTISIKCSEFENYFNNYKETILIDSLRIKSLLTQLNNLEEIDSTYSKIIDTRAKVELISSHDTLLICIGNLSLEKNGILYKTPDALIKLIENY